MRVVAREPRRTHFFLIYLFIHILQIHPASTQTRPLDRIHKIQRAGDDRGSETYCLLLQLQRSGAVDGHHVDVGGRRDGFLDARQRGRKGGTSRTR